MKNTITDFLADLGISFLSAICSKKAIFMWSVLLVIAILAVACSTRVSRDITPEGVAGEIIFPNPDDTTMSGGTFPNLDSLRLVKPGISKDQLYYLLGRPHFAEGFAAVREWDYLFHFREGDAVRTCQFKIIFDRDYLGQSFHWMPADCASLLSEQAPPAVAAVREERFQVSGDGLFAFAGSGIQDLSETGRAELSRFAERLAGKRVDQVEVTAHTDRIGSGVANQALSQARAESVRAFLIEAGVDGTRIRAIGMGELQPVKDCKQDMARVALVACLAPNRRVELRASGVVQQSQE